MPREPTRWRAAAWAVALMLPLAGASCSREDPPQWKSPNGAYVVTLGQSSDTGDDYVILLAKPGRNQPTSTVGCLTRGGPTGDFAEVVWDSDERFRVLTTNGGHADVRVTNVEEYGVNMAGLAERADGSELGPFECSEELEEYS